MSRTPVRRVGQESVSLQALVPWCSSCNGLMGRRGMWPGEAKYFRYYKRLGVIAKLATSYQYDAVTSAVINRLTQYRTRYVLLVPELAEALRLHDLGLQVVMGALDHPDTFQKVRADQAVGVVTTASDALNTNVVFTVRDVAPTVPLIATANDLVAGDMLTLAGCSYVLHLGHLLGQSLARRILGGDAVTHVIGQFDQLFIAEATAARTPLVGTTLRQSRLREQTGVSVIGVWDRGHFAMARPETPITPHTV